MEKIQTSLKTLRSDIGKFYNYKTWEFLTLNGVRLDEQTTEIQWIFSKYKAVDEVVIFYTQVADEDIIPSITDMIPSAVISQSEIIDMFGLQVEDTLGGLYLDEDSTQAPLSSCGIGAVKNG